MTLGDEAVRLRSLGISNVESYAWRDLDDPEAGGSEVHADEILRRWSDAGIDVLHRTSAFAEPRSFERNGYRIEQRGSRYDVFARVAGRQAVRRRPREVATVEIWNGVPWFGPLWAPRRRAVWMHHVHDEMWDDALPRPLSTIGRTVETRVAPLAYRRSRIATLSDSSAEEIVALGIPADRVTVIPPGVDERFTPAPDERSSGPSAVVVGRLAPVKRLPLALDAVAVARRRHPALTVDIVGDGPERARVERWVADHDAGDWVHVRGRVSDDDLVAAYRRAWVVLAASHAEGWGMSLTEGGACGTPSVATDIAGHRGAAIDGETGVLVGDPSHLGVALADLLADPTRLATLGRGAVDHASGFTWDAVAAAHLRHLADAVAESRQRTRSSKPTR